MAGQSTVTFEAWKMVEIFDNLDTYKVCLTYIYEYVLNILRGTWESKIVHRSDLFRAVVIPDVMQYYQIIEWVARKFDIGNRTMCAGDGQIFCASTPDDFPKMMGLSVIEESFLFDKAK